jgi:hypothetical protein
LEIDGGDGGVKNKGGGMGGESVAVLIVPCAANRSLETPKSPPIMNITVRAMLQRNEDRFMA